MGLLRAAGPCAGPRGSLSFGGGPAHSPSRRLQHPLGSSLLLSGAPPCFSALGITSVSGPGPNRPPHSPQPQGWVTSLACHMSAPPRLPFAPAAERPAASSGQSRPRQPPQGRSHPAASPSRTLPRSTSGFPRARAGPQEHERLQPAHALPALARSAGQLDTGCPTSPRALWTEPLLRGTGMAVCLP